MKKLENQKQKGEVKQGWLCGFETIIVKSVVISL